jgi:hypothetical protein
VTRDHLREETPAFTKKDECPPQSPDINPMDYTMWYSLSQKVYAGRTEKLTEITLAEIRKPIGAWKKRLQLVCGQDGGHIDHLL